MTAAERTNSERWLTPGVRGIGAASLLSDLGHEVPTALLPRFITSLGGSAAALGVIEGIADGLAGVARLAGGALADDPQRRRATVVGGYTSVAVLSGLIGAATSVWQVAVLRAGAWTARGLRVPSRNALLADATPREAYGRAYGFERMMDNLGAIGGPMLALLLVAVFSVRTAILLSIIPGLLATFAILYAIRRLAKAENRERQPIRLQVRPVIRAGLGRLMLGVSAFELGNVAATLLILRATELLEPGRGTDAATTTALVLYISYNAAATVASVPAGHAADRKTPAFVLMSGVIAFLVAYAIFAFVGPSVAVLALAFILAGVGIGCVETAEHAAVAASAPAPIRGSAFGLLASVQSFGNLAASGIAGIIWTVVSPKAAFLYIAAWMLVALAMLSRVGRVQSIGAGS
ncbi:MAG: MFS transporter [Actinomycetota bacterium]